MSVSNRYLHVALSALLLGCGESDGLPSVSVTDSAGVALVDNPRLAVEGAPQWEVPDEPIVNIGSGPSPAVTLFRVSAIAPHPDGRVAIGMTSPPRLLVAEPSGSSAQEFGRQGEGPGEFAGISSVFWLGADSLGAWDAERRRLSVFGPGGDFVRELDLSDVAPVSVVAAASMLEPAARTDLMPAWSGSFFLFSVGVFGPGNGVRRVRVPSFRIGPNGEVLDEVGAFPGEATFSSSQTGLAPYPLGPDTHVALGTSGFVVGSAESEAIEIYSPTGQLQRAVRWEAGDTLVEGERLKSWNSHLEAWLADMSPGEASSIREILEAMPEPSRFPAYSGLVVDDVGRIWVGAYHPGQLELTRAFMGPLSVPARQWLVFREDGVIMARVRMPTGFRPQAVAGDHVWGVHTDALGVESVRAYRVVRDTPGA